MWTKGGENLRLGEIKIGQVTHVAPLNRLPLLRFRPGGVSRSWSHEARPAANIVIPLLAPRAEAIFYFCAAERWRCSSVLEINFPPMRSRCGV